MRAAAPILALAGCYSATPPTEVPCDPSEPACPRGQQCVLGTGGYVCTKDPASVEPDVLRVIDAAIDAPPDGGVPVTKNYTATVAECLDPLLPSPTACRNLNGNTQMVIDTKDATTGGSWSAYIRFEIDGALAGKTITKVTLRAVSTSDAKAPGPDSGSVFRTAAFTRQSLDTTAPALMGNALAGSQGAVQLAMPVSWSLPPALVTANSSVYLAIVPNSEDGVNYYNIDGATPPRLIVEAQ